DHDRLAHRDADDEADQQAVETAHDPDPELPEVLEERHLVADRAERHYQLVTKCLRTPTPRPAAKPSRMAAVTYAFARLTAGSSSSPRASPAAIAEESVQPVPWVFACGSRSAWNRTNRAPSHRRSVAESLRWPPFTST